MTTYTRDKLERLYQLRQKQRREETIQKYVDSIKNTVFSYNAEGKTTYTHVHYGQPDVVKEVARRLQEIFIDSEVGVVQPDRIVLDWSNA